MTSTYEKYKDSALYGSVDQAIADLEENNDVVLTTAREVVVGYVTQQASKNIPSLLSGEEMESLIQAVNELANGVHIDDAEFQTRVGCTRDELRKILSKFR